MPTLRAVAKSRSLHRCRSCSSTFPQWAGRCSTCGEWNSLAEESATTSSSGPVTGRTSVSTIADLQETGQPHRPTGLSEVDRVLGGGFVPGSVALLSGEPGAGKSTLVLQLLAAMSAAGSKCLMVTGEESEVQVAARARRLGHAQAGLHLIATGDLETVLSVVDRDQPDIVVIDSIQTMRDARIDSGAGSVTQVRECAQQLVDAAKSTGTSVVLVGHVTKDGSIAGPRVLEHVVDTVMTFEGERRHALRLLRASKHRFGSTDELGVFEMTATGLGEVPDVAGLFIEDRDESLSGSVIFPAVEGRRPMMLEIQALVSPSSLPQPRRSVTGLDAARVSLLAAVLERRASVRLSSSDVFASVVGGGRVSEPAADLAIATALVSCTMDLPLPNDVVVLGEVGLGGEVRRVSHGEKRLAEASRLGFRRAIVPVSLASAKVEGMQVIGAGSVSEALGLLELGTTWAGVSDEVVL